jgi:hypothetical protein
MHDLSHKKRELSAERFIKKTDDRDYQTRYILEAIKKTSEYRDLTLRALIY